MGGMAVGTYFSPVSTLARPTGVITHAIEMHRGLMATAGIDAFLYCDRNEEPEFALPGVRCERYTPSDRTMRRMLLSGLPIAIDRLAAKADWVYSPRLQPVKTSKARLAVTIHDTLHFEDPEVVRYTPSASSTRRHRWLINLAIKRADMITVVSQNLKERLLSLFPKMKEERVVVVGNGAREEFYQGPKESDAEDLRQLGLMREPFVLYVGQLLYQKGADLLLDLAVRAKREGLKVTFAVAGREGDRGIVERLKEIEEKDGPLPIKQLGYVKSDSLAMLTRHAQALLLPSRCESFGIPAAEAMAAGTAVLASGVHGIPEVVADAGLLLEMDDREAWYEALRSVLEDAGLRSDLEERGKKRAESFRWSYCVERLVDGLRAA